MIITDNDDGKRRGGEGRGGEGVEQSSFSIINVGCLHTHLSPCV